MHPGIYEKIDDYFGSIKKCKFRRRVFNFSWSSIQFCDGPKKMCGYWFYLFILIILNDNVKSYYIAIVDLLRVYIEVKF